MEIHVSHCMAKAYACRTHGKPCVWHMASHVSFMHGPFMTYKYRIGGGGGAANSVRGGSSKEKEEEGKREREEMRREMEERKGEREENKRK